MAYYATFYRQILQTHLNAVQTEEGTLSAKKTSYCKIYNSLLVLMAA